MKPKLLQDRLVIGLFRGPLELSYFCFVWTFEDRSVLLLFENLQVSVRIRDSAAHSVKSIEDLLEEFKTKTAEYQWEIRLLKVQVWFYFDEYCFVFDLIMQKIE